MATLYSLSHFRSLVANHPEEPEAPILGANRAARRQKARRQIKYVRPWLYTEQEEFLFTPKRYSVVEACTKSGKTTGCLFWLTELAALEGKRGDIYSWIAPVYRQAIIAYTRFRRYATESLFSPRDGDLSCKLPNGASLQFFSGEKPDNLYGDDWKAAVIDEASRMREESFHAVRSALTATGGAMRIIGNVRRKKNWAYKLARRAEGGNPGMFFKRITAWDAVRAGIIPLEEVLDAQRILPAHVFQELYLAEASEDGSNPFGQAALNSVYMKQLAPGPVVAWGIDLAKSLDWCVLVGLNEFGMMAAFYR